MLYEQGYICCYCERRIEQENSHIEHFKPRSRFPEEELVYKNMLVSCQLALKPKEPRHCGMLKGEWYDEQWLVSPLTAACETRFRYTADGRVYPSLDSDEAASVTIEKLGLDIDKLRAFRRGVIAALLENSDDLEQEDYQKMYVNFQRKTNGRF